MKLFDVRDDCRWYGADCGDGSECDTACFKDIDAFAALCGVKPGVVGQKIKAHGKEWVIVYHVMGSFCFAVESDHSLPSPVQLIHV